MTSLIFYFQRSAVFTFILFALCFFFNYGRCHSASIFMFDGSRITTESPDNVEIFDPMSWTPKNSEKQVKIKHLWVETRVRLRYARTRIYMHLNNPHDAPGQTTFKITLPEDAFFSIFKMRLGKNSKPYTAKIESKEAAREIVHFANVQTNGTVSAALIESSTGDEKSDLRFYDMKFSLKNQSEVQAFLVFERQLTRKGRRYCDDEMQIFPLEKTLIDLVEMSVDVEELENVTSLGCSPKLKKYGGENCTSNFKHKSNKRNTGTFSWRKWNASPAYLAQQPLGFCYELEQKDSISAALIAKSDASYYMIHLFVPENLPLIRKHLVFVLDISDSMHGKKLEQLKWGMIEILDDISPDDYFSIITFSSDVPKVWSYFSGDRSKCPLPFPATKDMKDSARNFILDIEAHGMTNIYNGLIKAFDIIKLFSPLNDEKCDHEHEIKTPKRILNKSPDKLPPNVESIIIFLSDGIPTMEPTDTKAMLNFFRGLNQKNMSSPVQIHTVAYGTDADVNFLRALSLQNNGAWKVIKNESSAGIELVNFYDEISSQVLTKIQHSYYSTNDSDDDGRLLLPNDSNTSSLLLYNGEEIINVQNLSINNSNVTDAPTMSANLRLSTEIKGRNGYIQFESSVHDCTSLEKDVTICLEKLDFYLKRFQVYQSLKWLLSRDQLVEEGHLCPKSFKEEDIYQQLLISQYQLPHDYEDYSDEDENSTESPCVNPFKEMVVNLAKEHGFITPYTSFILTTELVDIGLTENSLYSSSSNSNNRNANSDTEGADINAAQESEVFIPINNKLESEYFILNDTIPSYENLEEEVSKKKNDADFIWFTKSVREYANSLFDVFFKRKKPTDRNHVKKRMDSNPINFMTHIGVG